MLELALAALQPSLQSIISVPVCRLDFIDRWATKGAPVVFWISGLFSPHVFIARALHAAARTLRIPVSAVSLESSWLAEVRFPVAPLMRPGLPLGSR